MADPDPSQPSSRPAGAHPCAQVGGWGDARKVPMLSEAVLTLLRDGLGVRTRGGEGGPIEPPALSAPRLGGEDAEALAAIVGAGFVRSDDASRVLHLRGKSTPDLLRVRAGDGDGAPDLVVLPGDHAEVLRVLQVCARRRIAVVPFGGGTSVVGGLELRDESAGGSGLKGVIALDVRRLNVLERLDEVSRLASLGPGLRGPEAEALLGARGYTIGHFPQSYEFASLGGFAAARSSGQASAGYGRFDELVVSLRVATPAGTLTLGRAPKSAAGPDLRQLVLGSEGAFGVITGLDVTVRPVPERRVYEGWRFPGFWQGAAALRRLAQDGPRPTVLRLSDEAETALNLARPGGLGAAGTDGGCLAIVGFEGAAGEVEARRAEVASVLSTSGASGPDSQAGEAWEHDRYRGPYLRDALIEAGALVETLETVGYWSALPDLYAGVAGALRASLAATGTPPVILCHISHVYAAGASLYFTVGCAAGDDPLGKWLEAKAAASDAILAAGGSITHHHGVGRDHLPWYGREIGELGIEVLRAVKGVLDPDGVMNPGALIPS